MEDTEIVAPYVPGQRLITHSLLNAVGQAAPIVVAVFAVPALVRQLGTERFGLLTLAWAVIGYFGLFDLGLGRALTQLIADRRRDAADGNLLEAVRSALTLMAIVGVVAGVAALAGARMVEQALAVSPGLRSEALNAFRLLAVGVPVVVLSSGYVGILQGYERFDLVTAVRVPLGITTFIGPLVVAHYTPSLPAAVGVLLVARVVGLIVQALMAQRLLRVSSRPTTVTGRVSLGSVLRSGGWMTVSNVLSPIMTMADRFFIGALVSTSVVAYYTAPYEMATKLSGLVAVAVATSLFPAFAGSRGAIESRMLFGRGLRVTAVAFAPLMIGIILFAHPILKLWMGADFARESAGVLRILGVGVLLNGLAQVPFALIQALGRADLTAKIHIAEVPAYLVLVLYLIRARGVEGAALAWTVRVGVDTALMFLVSRQLIGSTSVARALTEPA